MTTNYKSTIGGAFSTLGTTLIGCGVVPQLAGTPSKALLYVAIAGFVLQGVGQFLAHLFAADAQALRQLSDKVDLNTTAVMTGDTSHLTKPPPTNPS